MEKIYLLLFKNSNKVSFKIPTFLATLLFSLESVAKLDNLLNSVNAVLRWNQNSKDSFYRVI